MTMRKAVLTLMLALPVLTAHAQNFYYQSVMPDGRVIVGDKPIPGAKEVRQVPLRQGNISAPLSTPGQPGAAANPQQQAQDSADAEIRNAQQRLQNAKAVLEAGREPQSGERVGTAGGGSRLTDAYTQRIKVLEDAVNNAQRSLDDAYSRRNAAR